ncbi:hypothetical protein HDK64DRAFT_249144 [Phyllosticta capitalensis]
MFLARQVPAGVLTAQAKPMLSYDLHGPLSPRPRRQGLDLRPDHPLANLPLLDCPISISSPIFRDSTTPSSLIFRSLRPSNDHPPALAIDAHRSPLRTHPRHPQHLSSQNGFSQRFCTRMSDTILMTESFKFQQALARDVSRGAPTSRLVQHSRADSTRRSSVDIQLLCPTVLHATGHNPHPPAVPPPSPRPSAPTAAGPRTATSKRTRQPGRRSGIGCH